MLLPKCEQEAARLERRRMGMENARFADTVSERIAHRTTPWNKGKLTGAKPPLQPKHVWAHQDAAPDRGTNARCGIALDRKAWLFCGSDRGGHRAAVMYSLIVTCKLNDVDPQAWLADVLAGIAEHPNHRLAELMPWHWAKLAIAEQAA
jgi:hypothetical protein